MAPRLVRRRRDGMVEIRPVRARDVVFTTDAAVLAFLLAGFMLLALILVIALVFDPPLLGLAAWVVLVLAVDRRRSLQPRLAEAHASPPPPSAA